MYKANICITLRSSILDPQGKAVGHTLETLGYDAVERVRMGKYNRALMEVARQARALEDREALFELRDRLVDMLSEVVEDLDRERVTQDEFGHFSFTWQAVDGLVRDRITLERDGGRTR